MFRKLGPDKVGLLGAFLAITLPFLLSPDLWRERTAPETPRPERVAAEARSVRRPAPAAPAPRTLPGVSIQSKHRVASGTGTAFVVRPGAWMTARHVVDECKHLAFFTGPRSARGFKGPVAIEDDADLALIRVAPNSVLFGTEPIAMALTDPAPGDTGFHYGFPGEARGRVQSTLIGGTRMATRGYRNTDEPVLVWAEVRRDGGIPPGSLAGISGGPTLSAGGALVGVVVAGAPRRGRVFTTAPQTVRRALDSVPNETGLPAPRFESVPPSFSELERRGFVRRIFCKFEPPAS